MSRDEIYLRHIAEAIAKIERYARNLTSEAFGTNDLVIDAVVRVAEIVGMQNRLIHEYFGVDSDLVWKTIQDDLPALKSRS